MPILQQLNELLSAVKLSLPITLYLLAILWIVHFVNVALKYRLTVFGIYPRSWHGLLGVVCAPFLHGSFDHIFFNSIPLFILANLVLLFGLTPFIMISLVIILLAGLIVWCVGRKAFHVGASHVIMGYWAFLLVNAFAEGGILAIILGFVSLYYFGGLLLYLMPNKQGESWEGHVAGFVAGIAAVYLLPYLLLFIK